MKIALMTAWNTDSGTALHAEPLGRAWLQMGHEVLVFSHIKEDFHGDGFTREDEDFVIRCLGTQRTQYLDVCSIISSEFDVLVIQDIRTLPFENIAKVFPVLKRKGWVVHILHEKSLPPEPWFYQFDWDAVIYIDERQEFIRNVYPDAKYIPFPCHPLREVDKDEAKRYLNIPKDKKVILSFCQRGYEAYLRNLPPQLQEEVVLLLLVPKGYKITEEKTPSWMKVVEEDALSTEKFDIYLFASDVFVLHKLKSRGHAIVSSTVFQALGAGCPICVPEKSDFFYPLQNEIIRYKDLDDLNRKILVLLQDSQYRQKVLDAAKSFVLMNSPLNIARRYINFFISLMKKGRG